MPPAANLPLSDGANTTNTADSLALDNRFLKLLDPHRSDDFDVDKELDILDKETEAKDHGTPPPPTTTTSTGKKKKKCQSKGAKPLKTDKKGLKWIKDVIVPYLNDRAKNAQSKDRRIRKQDVTRKDVHEKWERIKATITDEDFARSVDCILYFDGGSAVYLNGWEPPKMPKAGSKRKGKDNSPRKEAKRPKVAPPEVKEESTDNAKDNDTEKVPDDMPSPS